MNPHHPRHRNPRSPQTECRFPAPIPLSDDSRGLKEHGHPARAVVRTVDRFAVISPIGILVGPWTCIIMRQKQQTFLLFGIETSENVTAFQHRAVESLKLRLLLHDLRTMTPQFATEPVRRADMSLRARHPRTEFHLTLQIKKRRIRRELRNTRRDFLSGNLRHRIIIIPAGFTPACAARHDKDRQCHCHNQFSCSHKANS